MKDNKRKRIVIVIFLAILQIMIILVFIKAILKKPNSNMNTGKLTKMFVN